ncbi:MAG: SWI/SNF complex component snf12 [Alectoria sarmentosa]|nr:MAG: SWI/SNF complex component snf12 [Alectoria sarmentosa]
MESIIPDVSGAYNHAVPMNPAHMPQDAKKMHDAQTQEQAKRAAEQAAIAKRRSEKPTDKTMPEGIEDLIVGDGVQQYKRMRELERKLDAVMMRKRLDQQDALHNATKKYSTLRVWVSNTVENQPWQGRDLDENAFDFTSGVEATYRVKIEGRVVEDEDTDDASENDSDVEDEEKTAGDAMDHDGAPTTEAPKQPAIRQRTKLSHFFKGITVDFDRNKNLQPDGTTQVEWKKPQVPLNAAVLPPQADFDCLEFERKSDENINCTINLYRDELPERCTLSKELANILDTNEDDRASVIMGIWEYVKAMGLQQDEEKRLIQCDDRLKAVSNFLPAQTFSRTGTDSSPNQVFKTDTIHFPHIPTIILPHLTPLSPLSLPYTIRVDPEFHASPTPTIYTLRLPTPPTLPSLPPSLQTLKQLSAYDEHLALLIQALGASQRKYQFLDGYKRDPVTFVKRWMSSQKRDLEVVLGESGRFEGDVPGMGLGGEWRRGGQGGVWGSEIVREGVGLMVQKGGRDGRAF